MSDRTDFRTLRDRIFDALTEYDHELKKERDKTQELADTCATLMVKKVELEDKVKELSDTIAKLMVQRTKDESQPDQIVPTPKVEKQVIHG